MRILLVALFLFLSFLPCSLSAQNRYLVLGLGDFTLPQAVISNTLFVFRSRLAQPGISECLDALGTESLLRELGMEQLTFHKGQLSRFAVLTNLDSLILLTVNQEKTGTFRIKTETYDVKKQVLEPSVDFLVQEENLIQTVELIVPSIISREKSAEPESAQPELGESLSVQENDLSKSNGEEEEEILQLGRKREGKKRDKSGFRLFDSGLRMRGASFSEFRHVIGALVAYQNENGIGSAAYLTGGDIFDRKIKDSSTEMQTILEYHFFFSPVTALEKEPFALASFFNRASSLKIFFSGSPSSRGIYRYSDSGEEIVEDDFRNDSYNRIIESKDFDAEASLNLYPFRFLQLAGSATYSGGSGEERNNYASTYRYLGYDFQYKEKNSGVSKDRSVRWDCGMDLLLQDKIRFGMQYFSSTYDSESTSKISTSWYDPDGYFMFGDDGTGSLKESESGSSFSGRGEFLSGKFFDRSELFCRMKISLSLAKWNFNSSYEDESNVVSSYMEQGRGIRVGNSYDLYMTVYLGLRISCGLGFYHAVNKINMEGNTSGSEWDYSYDLETDGLAFSFSYLYLEKFLLSASGSTSWTEKSFSKSYQDSGSIYESETSSREFHLRAGISFYL